LLDGHPGQWRTVFKKQQIFKEQFMAREITKSNYTPPGIHMVAKPIGPICNLNCDYCFYLEKQALFPEGENYRMTDKVLSTFITKYITSQPKTIVEFVWQGGEPTLLGINFFKKVIDLQRPFIGEKTISNALQTNGTLLTDEWYFFKKNIISWSASILTGQRKFMTGTASIAKAKELSKM